MKTPPCKECKERHPRCHGHCNKYIAWKAENKVIHDRRLYEEYISLMFDERKRKHK